MSIANLSWQQHAECVFVDPALFHPDEKARPDEEAEAACRRCPVRAECLAWAFEINDKHAYLAGTTASQREGMRRNERRRRQQGVVAA